MEIYSQRFGALATPIFYFIEMTWPYGIVHPISISVYVFCLVGLGLLVWRRKKMDIMLLAWFAAVYIFFTAIGNKQWRYMLPVFPVLALAAATLITSAYGKIEKNWHQIQPPLNRKRLMKVFAVGLIITGGAITVNSYIAADGWVAKDSAFQMPLETAVDFAADKLGQDDAIMVLCPLNVLSSDIVKFYVRHNITRLNYVGQYPEVPVDTYTPTFNLDELTNICITKNVSELILFEYGRTYPYFNSTLDMQTVYNIVLSSDRFSCQAVFGTYPCRIYVLSFS